jgi:alkanesulfonate monooxygenase SsuD/methylene tetrahydromethanopterin reductase-like flavin-dependent oxidoreductase (luciferase family)
MRIGYQLDLNKGAYDQPMPTPADAHDTMEQMITEGVLAERAGFHSIQVPHRHGRTENYFSGPEQILTILARETRRVAIGSHTFVATLTHPLKAAEQFAVVDNLSEGRLYTTLSRGYHAGYWQQFGVPQDHMLGRFQEAIEIWRLAFLGERFTFNGNYWQVEDGLLAPGPYQPGGWPIWGGGFVTPAACRRSADYGQCWSGDMFPIVEETWRERAGAYVARAEELGKEPLIVLMRKGWVADSYEDALAEFGTYVAEEMRFYWRHGIFPPHPDFESESDITAERIAPHLILGTAEQCMEQLDRFSRERGVDCFSISFRQPPGPDMGQVREQILRFGEQVVKPLQASSPALDHPAIPAVCRW